MLCCIHSRWNLLIGKLVLGAALLGALYYARGAANPAAGRVEIRGAEAQTREFSIRKDHYYGVTVSAPKLSAFARDNWFDVTVADSLSRVSKPLHAGDPDLYLTWKAASSGRLTVTITPHGGPAAHAELEVLVEPAAKGIGPGAQLASAGHTTWQTAEPIELGRPVYASGDDRPYIPRLSRAEETFAQMMAGIHWYRLDYAGPGDRLVHFNVDILDRDVPLDIAIFTVKDGAPAPYTHGRERYETEKSTNFHGLQKFAPRVIRPGTYYIRVMGNHPFYKLTTDHYPPPPYTDPQLAVRAGMDYVIRKGDSWHANVPREGAVALRNSVNIQETRLCIACHPTQFSTRGELFAIDNGYPVRARASLEFLAERLYNNPRPLYGKPDASWARMIHAPGNVLSRVAYLADRYDRLVTGERREELYRGIGAYLEMYWPGMTEPSHESNGNLPRISGFEVAMHNAMLFEDLHKRTGDVKYKALRDQIEQVVVDGKVDDTLDLCWKIDALVSFGREKHARRIAELRDRLLSLQQPDGRWAMPFGLEEVQYDFQRQKKTVKKIVALPGQQGPRAAEFQTWHAVYALARAGVTVDDPRLRKSVDLMLALQKPSGAWQGAPDYKNFDTPFRDTQYALMALSTLFPGPKGRGRAGGWDSGFPTPAASFSDSNPAAAVGALDDHWSRPAEHVASRIRRQLESPHVLVRYQAAVALGRFGGAESVTALAARLGDRSKLVQRAAAWALRQIASRRPHAREAAVNAIAGALDSADERTRWGAARVFNQHFKYLSEDWRLGSRLCRLAAEDRVPSVKMAAAHALYQWWFWDRDPSHKAAVEETLAAGLDRDEHPWVRRAFIESYYATLDDNVRYLYGSWLPRVKKAEDRKAIDEGHKAMVRAQAGRFLAAMRKAGPLGRDGLLRALYTHHVREGLPDVSALAGVPVPPTVEGHWVSGYRFSALFDPLTGGTAAFSRIGNDAEPPVFYADSAPLMNEAFLVALDGAGPGVVSSAMRALTFLRGLKLEPALAARILELVEKGPAAARAEAAAVAKSQLRGFDHDQAALDRLVASGDPVALDVLAAFRKKPSPAAIAARLLRTQPDDRAFPLLVAMSGGLLDRADVLSHISKGFASRRPQPQQAVVRLALAHPDRFTDWRGYPENYGPFAVGGALSVIGSLDYGGADPAVLAQARRILMLGLNDKVHTIRAQALTVLRSVAPLHKDPEILARVAALKQDPEKAVRASAASFESSQLARAGAGAIKAEDVLDYFYFKEHVEPILLRKGADGDSCAKCHANHTLLALNDADEHGVVTLARSRANYASVAKMVNVAKPEASLLLNKPVAPLDDAGIGDSQAFTHGGGIRWPDRNRSEEYRTILRWIQGARLDSDASSAGGGGGGAR